MRFVITDSFDKTEVNHFFEADIACRIGQTIRSRGGKVYRVKDVAWVDDDLMDEPNIRILLARVQ